MDGVGGAATEGADCLGRVLGHDCFSVQYLCQVVPFAGTFPVLRVHVPPQSGQVT